MGSIDIIKPLSTVSAITKSHQHQEKNFRECRESNLGCWVRSNAVPLPCPILSFYIKPFLVYNIGPSACHLGSFCPSLLGRLHPNQFDKIALTCHGCIFKIWIFRKTHPKRSSEIKEEEAKDIIFRFVCRLVSSKARIKALGFRPKEQNALE